MELTVQIVKKLRDFTLRADFSLHDEVMAVLGASGSGKSMTLKCIAGIETPDEGRIVLNGRTLFDSTQGINVRIQDRRVGYLFQDYALFPNMNVAENIAFVTPGGAAEKAQKVQAYLQEFKLADVKAAYPRELSGGQQQRAALARLLAAEPELVLLDEPLSALDTYLRWQLEQVLRETLAGRSAILVTHDRGEAYRLAGNIAVLAQGQLQQSRRRESLFQNPDTLAEALLTGCKNVSAAQKIDSKKIMAQDWQLPLTVQSPVPDKIKYVGIRAHYMELGQAGQANTFTMEVVQVVEDVFSYLVMLRVPHTTGVALRWELPKPVWEKMGRPSLVEVYFPPNKLMIMEE
jgi:molybdate transport system ATP-binding protein